MIRYILILMCGRYTYYSAKDLIENYKFLNKSDHQTRLALDAPDNYNVTPGSKMPVIVAGQQKRRIELMTWGIIPNWSKEPHTKLKLINARQEALFEKPLWKSLAKSKRCIVPARGFYEWKDIDGNRQPYYISPKKGNLLSFAGLYDEWQGSNNELIRTFCIITTSPNAEMAKIHNRMPAILSSDVLDLWLSDKELEQDLINDILQKPQDNILNLRKVSKLVNNPNNNSKELIYTLDN